MDQKQIETKSLILSSIASLIITISGISIYIISDVQFLFLDCLLAFISLISSLLAIFITKKSKDKTKTYPDGLYFLEPLYAILKSIFILSLLISSITSTFIKFYKYFVYKIGVPINNEVVLHYLVFTIIICFVLGIYQKNQNNNLNNTSILLKTESKINFIECLQSLGILISFIFLSLIDINSKLGFLHYTIDFFITTILVLFSLKEPIKIIINSFKELTCGTINDSKIINNINIIINYNLSNINKKCHIFKIGTKITIRITIIEKLNEKLIQELEVSRNKIIKQIKKDYENIELIFII